MTSNRVTAPSLRVLIADDDFHVARLHASIVDGTSGFTALPTVGTVEGVLQTCVQTRPDLILLDAYLPDGNGINVLPRLDVDCFIISAASDPPSIRRALRRGALCYLIKPFPNALLSSRLQSYSRFRNIIEERAEADQDTLERAMRALHPVENTAGQPRAVTESVILTALGDREEPVSAAEIASIIGISRATAQRYLSVLVDGGFVHVRLRYGSTGRPEHLYTIRQ